MGVNSGFVNVEINLGLLDMGTNTPSGSLEVAYNGPKLRTYNGTLNGPFKENHDLNASFQFIHLERPREGAVNTYFLERNKTLET